MPTRSSQALDNRHNLRANGNGSEEYEVNYYGDETFLKIDVYENEKNTLQAKISGLERRIKVLVVSVIVLLILLIGTLIFSTIQQINIGKSLQKLSELENTQYRIQTKVETLSNYQENEPKKITELSKSLQKSAETKIVLKGGDWYSKGNVFWNGKPVCDDGWNSTTTQAQVVCRSLGFKTVNIFHNLCGKTKVLSF